MLISSTFQAVKEQMEVMKDKDTLLSVRNANHQKLLSDLENVVVSMRLSLLTLENIVHVQWISNRNHHICFHLLLLNKRVKLTQNKSVLRGFKVFRVFHLTKLHSTYILVCLHITTCSTYSHILEVQCTNTTFSNKKYLHWTFWAFCWSIQVV